MNLLSQPRRPRVTGALAAAIASAVLLLTGCQSLPRPALQTVAHVDLPQFMGDWYVIATIPTFLETTACNAVESYRLQSDGTIATTFTFHEGSPAGPLKRYEPTGYVQDASSHAVWGMQFLWPIRADYRITWVNPDYTQTIISREARDYVWIMAKTPQVSAEAYDALVQRVAAQGYDVQRLRKVPQEWPAGAHPPPAAGGS